MNNLQVLVVEDEYDGQQVISEMLEYMHIQSDVAETAEKAMELLARASYNAIIIDIALPGMDGIELLKAIRSENSFDKMPCIVMTAYHSSQVKQEVIQAGCDAYFPKPVDDTTFYRELERLLR